MLLVPYHADVVMDRIPIANWVLIAVTVVVSFWGFFAPNRFDAPAQNPYAMFEPVEPEPTPYDRMVLDGWQLPGLFSHMFLHAGLLHLLGNMIFLFVFGNAICAKVGNLWYPVLYLGVGLTAAIAHLLFDGSPALGASGAINGMVGMFLVYYPINEIRVWWWAFVRAGTFEVSSVWMILLWLGFDLWGAFGGGGSTAYAAHVGGFLAGFGLASVLLLTDLVPTDEGERSIYEAVKGGE